MLGCYKDEDEDEEEEEEEKSRFPRQCICCRMCKHIIKINLYV